MPDTTNIFKQCLIKIATSGSPITCSKHKTDIREQNQHYKCHLNREKSEQSKQFGELLIYMISKNNLAVNDTHTDIHNPICENPTSTQLK
jgi:hypothetical protein